MGERDPRVHENPILGDRVTFLQTSAESGGALTLLEIALLPHAKGPPAHYHKKYVETFRCLEGELTVCVGKQKHTLRPGETIAAAAHQPHTFANESDAPVRFTAETRPGSPGFEASLKIGYGLARDGEVRKNGLPKKLSHMAILFDIAEGYLPGAMAIVEPLLGWVARRARKSGVEAALLARYG